MLDSNDSNPDDSSGASRRGEGTDGGLTTTGQAVPARGLLGPRSPDGPESRPHGSSGRHGSSHAKQQTDGSSPVDDDNDPPLPSSRETAQRMMGIAKACALGFMDPTQARATASILKDMNQICVQQEAADRTQASAAAACQRSASNGCRTNEFGEPADRPSPGAPRMVPSGVIDAMLEVAMAHQPQLLQDLAPVLDEEQLNRVTEFVSQRMSPGEPNHDGR